MYKLGSLFSGSGGFELAGAMAGFEPVFASEIEAFPIAVTTKRFPQMKHLGDVRNINGAEIEPVDVITFGSPCQDFSIAGNRAGIEGKRSGLFTEAIRIIAEMRYKTDGKYPRFAVFENVPGLFSSGKGEDFRTVLEEFAKVKEADISIPMPAKSKWHNAGNIVGDGWSVAWRVLNAQYFGVAQRRRRIYLVADFGGECAGEVLFEREGVQRHTETCGETGETSAADTEGGVGASGFNGWRSVTGSIEYCEEMSPCLNTKMPPNIVLNDQDGSSINVSEDIVGTLRAESHGNVPCIVENHSADGRMKSSKNGNVPLVLNERQYALTVGENLANTLTETDYKGTQCVFEPQPQETVLAVHQNQQGEVRTGKVANTLNTNSNASGRNSPLVAHTYCVQGNTIDRSDSAGANGSGIKEDVSFTLNTVDRHAVCYQDVVGSLCASDYKFPQQQQIVEGKAIVERFTFGNNGHSHYTDKPATLKASGGDFPGGENLAVEVHDNIGGQNGSEIETYTRKVLSILRDEVGAETVTEWGLGILNTLQSEEVLRSNMYGRCDVTETDKSDKLGRDTPSSAEDYAAWLLRTVWGRESKGCTPCRRESSKQRNDKSDANMQKLPHQSTSPKTLLSDMWKTDEGLWVLRKTLYEIQKVWTPIANESKPTPPSYAVRRLTPLEACRLQGFPDYWSGNLERTEPTEEDIAFWLEVFETYRKIMGTSTKRKSRNQIIKWLKNPHSDSAEYKMWGNGIALPCAAFVLAGVAEILRTSNTKTNRGKEHENKSDSDNM